MDTLLFSLDDFFGCSRHLLAALDAGYVYLTGSEPASRPGAVESHLAAAQYNYLVADFHPTPGINVHEEVDTY